MTVALLFLMTWVYCLSIYKMNVMVNNKNLSKYGEYHGKRTNAY